MKHIKNTIVLGILLVGIFMGKVSAAVPVQLNRFPDVPTSNTFFEYIEILADAEIVGGYSSGNFEPGNNLERQQLAKFIKNGFEIPTNTSCEAFPDVDGLNVFYTEIMSLKCAGVIKGYGDGSFKPQNTVTRAETMTFIIKAARIKNGSDDFLNSTEANPFSDVNDSSVHFGNIISGYYNGIVSGSNGKFMPDEPVTRGAISKMITNTRLKLELTSEFVLSYFQTIKNSNFVIEETDDFIVYYPDSYKSAIDLNNMHTFANPNLNSVGGNNNITVQTIEGMDDGVPPTEEDCISLGEQVLSGFQYGGEVNHFEKIEDENFHGCYLNLKINSVSEPYLILETYVLSDKNNEPGSNEFYEVSIAYSNDTPTEEIMQLIVAQTYTIVK